MKESVEHNTPQESHFLRWSVLVTYQSKLVENNNNPINKYQKNNKQIHFNLHASFLPITNQNVMSQGKSTTKIQHFIYNQRKEASLPPPPL